MRLPRPRRRAAARTLAVALCGTAVLSGCSLFHHRTAGCKTPKFALAAENHPPLVVPEGLSAPDTRNAIRIPELNEPERPRAKNEPCLSEPPSYGSNEARPAVAKPAAPTSQATPPAIAPAPPGARPPDTLPPDTRPPDALPPDAAPK